MPDAHEFGDVGAHTLGNIFSKIKKLELPNLYSLGLGHIKDARLPKIGKPLASFGRLAAKTKAKDTTSGHWELAGLVMDPPFATFTNFPDDLLKQWLRKAGMAEKWLANRPASGTQIIDELGEEHIKTGAPIVYTSADSVFQVAAHEEVIPIKSLYHLCQIAREMLSDDLVVGRVIARPFVGNPGNFTRTKNRRDFALPPVGKTMLDALQEKGQTTLGIGKIDDIFCNQGVAHSNHTTNNTDGITATIEALKNNNSDTIIFTNLVDFDMQYGHRNDTRGYAQALEQFDSCLPRILDALRPSDLLLLTADHGCDPTTPGTDHTREYVPILAYGGGQAVDLGTRSSFADVAATIYEALGHGAWPIGESFYSKISGDTDDVFLCNNHE